MQQRLGHKLLNISTDICTSSTMVSHVTLLSLMHFDHVTSLRLTGLPFLPAREKKASQTPCSGIRCWSSGCSQKLMCLCVLRPQQK